MNTPAVEPKFVPKNIRPTGEQIAFQVAQKRFILADANAGAAKTTTLALRIIENVYRGRQPEHILALVFTDAAKQALHAHLKTLGLPAALVKRLVVDTFDEFAGKVLRKLDGVQVDVRPSWEALKPAAQQALWTAIDNHRGAVEDGAFDVGGDNASLTQFLNLQLRIKATLALHASAREQGEQSLADYLEALGIPRSHYLWYVEYERLRGSQKEIPDFRGPFDATYDLVRALDDDPGLRELLPAFPVIVADELHDLNEATFRLLVMLIRRGNAFFSGAGDKDQVIYSWSGADHGFLRARFREEFPTLQTLPLTASYRYGAELSEAITCFKGKPCSSAAGTRTRIVVGTYDHTAPGACADALVAMLAAQDKAAPLHETIVLLRDRDQTVRIENALFQNDVPYRFIGMESYLRTPEVLMLRGMVAVAMKNLHVVADRALREQIYDALTVFAEIADTRELIEGHDSRKIIADNPEFLEGFLTHKLQLSENEARAGAAVDAVAYLRGVDEAVPVGEALRRVAEIMRLKETARRIYVDRNHADVVIRSIDGFIDVSAASGVTLGGFAEWISAREAALLDTRASKLTIACVDHVKGLEFSHVVMPFMEHDEFPRRAIKALEEENRFYVAITRAIGRLSLLTPQDSASQSRFLAAMQIDRSIARGEKLRQKARIQADIAERTRRDNAWS